MQADRDQSKGIKWEIIDSPVCNGNFLALVAHNKVKTNRKK